MKRNKADHATSYSFQAGEQILVDANVWLFVQPPAAQPPPHFSKSYSAALKNLLAAGAQPVIEALVLSEYLNRYCASNTMPCGGARIRNSKISASPATLGRWRRQQWPTPGRF